MFVNQSWSTSHALQKQKNAQKSNTTKQLSDRKCAQTHKQSGESAVNQLLLYIALKLDAVWFETNN